MNEEPSKEQERDGPDWLRVFLALVALGGLIAFNLWYTAHERRESDRRWCELVTSLDDRWRAVPSPAPEAVKLSAALSKLRSDLRCSLPQPVETDPRPSPSFRS